MIDDADLAIIETHLDDMNPVERGLVEELRRTRDELEEAQKQLLEAIPPSVFAEVEECLREAEEARDAARDLAEEHSKEVDALRSQLTRAQRREDDAVTKATESRAALENILEAIQTKLGSVTS